MARWGVVLTRTDLFLMQGFPRVWCPQAMKSCLGWLEVLRLCGATHLIQVTPLRGTSITSLSEQGQTGEEGLHSLRFIWRMVAGTHV